VVDVVAQRVPRRRDERLRLEAKGRNYSGHPRQAHSHRAALDYEEHNMSAEENKALVRRFYEEVWDKGNTEFAFEVFAEDYVRHDFRSTPAVPGPAGQKKIADDFRAAFPDLRVTVDLVFGEEDWVVGRWTATGTNLGSWGATEPTGRRVTFSAANIYRFENGKVAEIWNHRDDLGLQEQLGVPIYAGATSGD
jgi:predicted ester cyclase